MEQLGPPLFQETFIWSYKYLYAGHLDYVGEYKDTLYLVDWKTSTRPKKREWLEDYYLQIAAYVQALDESYGIRLRQDRLLIATPEECQNFNFNHQHLCFAFDRFKLRLRQFVTTFYDELEEMEIEDIDNAASAYA